MLVLLLVGELAIIFDLASDRLICIFDPLAFIIGCFGGKFSVGADSADHFGPLPWFVASLLGDEQFIIDFTKCRRFVNRTASTVRRYEIRSGDPPSEMFFCAVE
mgnify:CR=1 FL=1